MTCSGCATVVEETVAPIRGITTAFVDFDARRLNISVASDVIVSMKDIVESLDANGFKAVLAEDGE